MAPRSCAELQANGAVLSAELFTSWQTGCGELQQEGPGKADLPLQEHSPSDLLPLTGQEALPFSKSWFTF